ncbi:hypothetical protein DM01DRAFT_1082787 [Hesseltinella vesiculosa]|uniref:Uncharacterized protein n=1 Tax=Hesseltinella vesiculosa TaxID=101127 RepID=A0A1X2GE81_9FUNG|nr:hypothetical protein DM01DRAFT_1082787 [Hesseltinella vesiculosa]
MGGTKKWVLQSGKRVEDAFYTFGMKCTTEHICHSFDDLVYIVLYFQKERHNSKKRKVYRGLQKKE